MEPIIYIKAFGMGLGIWLLSALPLVVATVIALLSRKAMSNKLLFVISSGVVTYGIATLTFVAFLPFVMLATYFAPQWQVQGYETLANVIAYLAEAGDIVPIIAVLAGSFVVPILGRKKYWDIFCECMANK